MTAKRPAFLTIMLIIALTAASAALGALVSGGSDDPWYAALTKPAFNPPDFVFGIVWPILFTLMVIGAVLVRLKAGSFNAASSALGLYFTQLAVGIAWSWLFFGFHQLLYAMVALVILWLLIVAMMRSFARHSLAAAVLQLPYLAWISFAGVLNASLLILNQ
ncbi:MAG: TspO/MBR family protein [Pseudomonadota bacterium]